MYYQKVRNTGRIRVNDSYEAESLEEKLERVMTNKEPIDNTAPLIYTERKEGVQAQYDIRTDRFELAQQAMDTVSKSLTAQREEAAKTEGESVTYVTD